MAASLIPEETRARVGELLSDPVTVTIDRRESQRYALAVGDENPIYFDEDGNPLQGYLTMGEVFEGLHLSAELVVLSACETVLGEQVHGEGLVGLTRGMLYAGAARVMASLWAVQDDSTAELMVRFYDALHREKMRPAAALRAAQLAMARSEKLHWRSPYHWAGFQIQGIF